MNITDILKNAEKFSDAKKSIFLAKQAEKAERKAKSSEFLSVLRDRKGAFSINTASLKDKERQAIISDLKVMKADSRIYKEFGTVSIVETANTVDVFSNTLLK